jgi:hypothetical protein
MNPTPLLIAKGLATNADLHAMGRLTFREVYARNADLWRIARENGWTDQVRELVR